MSLDYSLGTITTTTYFHIKGLNAFAMFIIMTVWLKCSGKIHICAPSPAPIPPRSCLAAGMATFTPDLQLCLLWGSNAKSFYSLQSLFVSRFYVILDLPSSRFPPNFRSQAVLTAPLEHSTCPYQLILFSFRIRSRSLMASRTSTSLNLMVTMTCGLTLQICLIIALSFRCRRWRFGFVNGQVSLDGALRSAHELYKRPCILEERWREKKTWSSLLSLFRAVYTHVVAESSQQPAAESVSLRY